MLKNLAIRKLNPSSVVGQFGVGAASSPRHVESQPLPDVTGIRLYTKLAHSPFFGWP
jgi:hypothetical protein